ncbi:MAG: Holliday junction resolvase RuvX [Candidatus Cloacimonadales bacterium]|jgi:putative Holliday junction resolvase|nr:Holliday junction resolvase RuvX [Candidatus Cloacimonadota bacterium]MDY0381984.1 Holliday junction resolvase RuvX [Candidatus Cloacimonadaceae bacterium]HCM15839.1 Holliday junction resolvase RuvX [Candidatus Cloacimonas sp.]MCB5257092.1 Holliday junction resolvase RuvX [Candidatus Cloacimonadota bacterium]MCB5264540.1 Holliday junction resolvase RuvX [Candidatus Cloacimonadota bacterium]
MIGRIMAIDYGSKRIGIAFSDPLRMFAKAHSVIANADLNILVPRLKQLAKQQDARLIVLGMPYAIDGSDTPKTLETKAFMKNLQELLDIPVISFDERYSSAEAEAELKKIGKSWQEARKMVDAMAAAMILKSYLESENR